MAIAITHPFVSAKGDGGDATLVRPSNWNAVHDTTMATGNLIGRSTSGAGAFEEVAASALVMAALGETTGAAFLAALGVGAFETGDVKFSVSPNASAGWIFYQGIGYIGNASSGADVLAGPTAFGLYFYIYTFIADAYCPVTGGRSGDITADFNAGKKMLLPRFTGRAIIGAGADSGVSVRNCGQAGGAETHTITGFEMPSHAHAGVTIGMSGNQVHSHTYLGTAGFSTYNTGGGGFALNADQLENTSSVNIDHVHAFNTNTQGGGGPHNNMPPFVALWVKIKL